MWNSVFGQASVKSLLQRAIINGKVAHAYIFSGARGVGKEALALAFAKVVNCEQPVIDGHSIEQCGTCRSCKQMITLEHPNLEMLFPLPAGKSSDNTASALGRLPDDVIVTIREQIAREKAEDPYYQIDLTGATQIRIQSIRDVKKRVSLSAAQKGRRCVLIFDAETMTNEAANSFLKTLEEPHENITFILTTTKKDQIPQTIRSRCQHVYCPMISNAVLIDVLRTKHRLSIEQSNLTALFAQGSYSRALDFMEDDMSKLRQDIVEVLRSVLKKNQYRVDTYALLERIVDSKDKRKVAIMLSLLMAWLRDTYSIRIGGDAAQIVNVDQTEPIRKFSHAFAGADIEAIMFVLEEAARAVNRNVNIHLTLITALLECRTLLLSGRTTT